MPAKRGRKRTRRNFTALPFQSQLSLSTLADNTILIDDLFGSALLEDLSIISVDAFFALRTGTAGEGPIVVGYAHGDLTATEIKEKLTANLFDPDDIIAKERSRRPVRDAGIFPVLSLPEVLNNGNPLRTPIRFLVGSGKSFNIWVWNQSGGNLTTGMILETQGKVYGRWIR